MILDKESFYLRFQSEDELIKMWSFIYGTVKGLPATPENEIQSFIHDLYKQLDNFARSYFGAGYTVVVLELDSAIQTI